MNFNAELGQKNSFRFNELTSVVGVKPYVLRFWESEFEQIRPEIDQDGQKFYSAADLEYVHKIKELLFDEKYSIVQAKKYLSDHTVKVEADEDNCIQHLDDNYEKRNENISENNSVVFHNSSLELMKKALASELHSAAQSITTSRSQTERPVDQLNLSRELSDKDIVNLVQAKKKLTGVLSRINEFLN